MNSMIIPGCELGQDANDTASLSKMQSGLAVGAWVRCIEACRPELDAVRIQSR